MSLIPEMPFADDWTADEHAAVAAREQAKLRVFDAAHREDEPHWRDESLIERFISERAERVAICCTIAAIIVGSAVIAAANVGWL